MIDDGVLVVDGKRYEARWVGPAVPRQPTLVFLHEGLGCVGLWRDFPDVLTARCGLGAFLFSRLGFGGSDAVDHPPAADYHEPEALDVLPKILLAAGITRPVLIGHSDGGTIALLYAGGHAVPPPVAVVTIAAHVFNEAITVAGIEQAKQAFQTTSLRQRLARYHGRHVDDAFWGWCNVWLSPEFRAWNIEGRLSTVRCPLLVIQGTADHYGSAAQVEAIVRGVAGPARPLLLPGLGHSPHLEDPDLVAGAIAEFVGGVCSSASD